MLGRIRASSQHELVLSLEVDQSGWLGGQADLGQIEMSDQVHVGPNFVVGRRLKLAAVARSGQVDGQLLQWEAGVRSREEDSVLGVGTGQGT